jgi:ankyrin repeat protein
MTDPDTFWNIYPESLAQVGARGDLVTLKFLAQQAHQSLSSQALNMLMISASHFGHTKMVKWLISEQRVDPRANNAGVLEVVAAQGNLELVSYLVDRITWYNMYEYQYLSQGSRYTKIQSYLKELLHHESVDTVSPENPLVWFNKALIAAASQGHLKVIKFLVKHEADLHTQDDQALIMAASKGSLKVLKYLMAHHANPRAQNSRALIEAASQGHLSVLKYLIKQGGDPLAQNYLALKEATRYQRLPVIKYLIKRCPDITGLDLAAHTHIKEAHQSPAF